MSRTNHVRKILIDGSILTIIASVVIVLTSPNLSVGQYIFRAFVFFTAFVVTVGVVRLIRNKI